jgi:hypothetical protein
MLRFTENLSINLGLQIARLCSNWDVLGIAGVDFIAYWASGPVQNNIEFF